MSNKYLNFTKYQLYFDRERKNYITFTLENIKNCIDIYNLLGKEIGIYLSKIHGKEKDKKKYYFILINKIENSSLIELKLKPTKPIIKLLTTNQYNLFYLPIEKKDRNFKKKLINHLEEKNDNVLGVEIDSLIKTNQLENYLENEGVYWLNKKNLEFLYGKGNINEKLIKVVFEKTVIKIKMNEIGKFEYYENKIPPILEGLEIKLPNYICIIYHNNTSHIFGVNSKKSYLNWKKAINLARIKYNNFYVHSTLNANISTYNYQYFVRSQSITTKLFSIKQILENFEKRKIFFDEFNDKKIVDIIKNIYLYKINFKKKKFFEAWINLKQISFFIDFNNINNKQTKEKQIEKYSNIFTQERINLYNEKVNKANEAMSQVQNFHNYEESMDNALKNIFEIDLFDPLYFQIYQLYIEPYFEKIQKELNIEYNYNKKPIIVQKYHLLLSIYCIKSLNMKNIDNFNCLCSSYSTDTNMSNIKEIRSKSV